MRFGVFGVDKGRNNIQAKANQSTRNNAMLLPMPPRTGTPGLWNEKVSDKKRALRQCVSLTTPQEADVSRLAVLETAYNAQATSLVSLEKAMEAMQAQVATMEGQHARTENDVKELKSVGSLWVMTQNRTEKLEAAIQKQTGHPGDTESCIEQIQSCVKQVSVLEQQVATLQDALDKQQHHSRDAHAQSLDTNSHQIAESRKQTKVLECIAQGQKQQHNAKQQSALSNVASYCASSAQLQALQKEVRGLEERLRQQEQDQLARAAADSGALEKQVKALEASVKQQQQQQEHGKVSSASLQMLEKQVKTLEASVQQQQQQQQEHGKVSSGSLLMVESQVKTLSVSLGELQQQVASCGQLAGLERLQVQIKGIFEEQAQASTCTATSMALLKRQVNECEGFLELAKNQQDIFNKEISSQMAELGKQLRETQQQQSNPQLAPDSNLKSSSTALFIALERQFCGLDSQLQQVQKELSLLKEQQELLQLKSQTSGNSQRSSQSTWVPAGGQAQLATLLKRVEDMEKQQQVCAMGQEQLQLDAARSKATQAFLERGVREVERALQQREQLHSSEVVNLTLQVAALERQLKELDMQRQRSEAEAESMATKITEALDAASAISSLKCTCTGLTVDMGKLERQCAALAQKTLKAMEGDHAEVLANVQGSLCEAHGRLELLENESRGNLKASRIMPSEMRDLETHLMEHIHKKDETIQQLRMTVDLIVADINKMVQAHKHSKDISKPGLPWDGDVPSLRPFTLTSAMQAYLTYEAASEKFAKKSSLKDMYENTCHTDEIIIKVIKGLGGRLHESIGMMSKALLRTAHQVDLLHNEVKQLGKDDRARIYGPTTVVGFTKAGTRSPLQKSTSIGQLSGIQALLASQSLKGR